MADMSLIRMGLRRLWAYSPWNKQKLIRNGKRFAWSDNCVVTAYPTFERKEDRRVKVSERTYEYYWTLRWLNERLMRNDNIIDIGGAGSFLPPAMAALGFNVTTVDVRRWNVDIGGLTTLRREVSGLMLGQFDACTCISTLEHIGLGRYGDPKEINGDYNALDAIYGVLKPGGVLILSVPFGHAGIAYDAHRVYDNERLNRMLDRFDIEEYMFHAPNESGDYIPLAKVPETSTNDRPGIITVFARKPIMESE